MSAPNARFPLPTCTKCKHENSKVTKVRMRTWSGVLAFGWGPRVGLYARTMVRRSITRVLNRHKQEEWYENHHQSLWPAAQARWLYNIASCGA